MSLYITETSFRIVDLENCATTIFKNSIFKWFFFYHWAENFNLRFKECDTKNGLKVLKILLNDEILQIFRCYDPLDFKNLTEVASGGSALVYNVYWKNISKLAIKKFDKNFNQNTIINEILLTGIVNSHPNIIQFYGVTKLKDEINYSLVLEYADGGTLRNYLRNNTITFEWKNQLRFAKEIASAILWLHDNTKVIHGDLHPNNILIHKDTIKLADFGRSCQKGSANHTKACGVIPYMDPKFFEENHSYGLTEKSDMYSLGILFWELTSRLSPFDFENKNHLEIIRIKQDILNNKLRETPIPGTNDKFVSLYKKCWQHEPDERPYIDQVIQELDSFNPIDPIDSENNCNCVSTGLNSNESVSTENEIFDLPSCEDYDINSDRYNISVR
ncbi:uncharacterized protein OCT59_029242 [Rhizophagus irregularis]|uniref:Protein kinase domain-containing protein n=1 Tax=Rhizophagus irregularis TaxID=588596 RepID=A0A915ZSR4_9GLOM|nr:hypothetical protein OCT59_029242 [Rhizophagus irregularis]GBC40782.1 kinase-like domain-containing protein [Rhizophagus irregularis DAOM 181602=DAOM 197198]CAB5388433.1 unnamed protein product [Rhizophagus irregularis]